MYIVFNTKYKLRDNKNDSKHGVSQSDMYQMISYGFKRGVENLYLLYPNSEDAKEMQYNEISFTVQSGFNGDTALNIKAIDVPFWTLRENPGQIIDNRFIEKFGSNIINFIE